MAYLYINEYTFLDTNGFAPFVSIIVPVFNEGKVIKESIKSLLNLDYKNYEIIIVNDGSSDDTKQIAESLFGYQQGRYNKIKVSLINQPNLGKARALNAGIYYSKADFVLSMDGDSQLSPESLKAAVRHFKDPKIGAVAGNVKVLNRKRFFTDLQALEYIEGLNMARSAQSYIKLVNIIPGPIGLFRRAAIEQAGFYSSDTYAEDADLTLKILAKDWKIYYEPKAISYTQAPVTLQQLLKQRYRWTRGILQSLRKHKKLMLNPTVNFGHTFVLWAMSYEALIWPTMNIAANAFFIFAAIFFGFSHLIFFWWAGLAILDMVTALYCIAVEKEEFRLIWYAIIYRMFFILIIDICKTMSTIEEFLGIRMTWGKLERENIIQAQKIAA
jgi:cellulose synthase/poly-beta-1,6-N-acetylglucosamine synthase-like glycosyltransferase